MPPKSINGAPKAEKSPWRNFERLKTFIPDLSQFNGKQLKEVMEYVDKTYDDTHYIPDIKYWEWLMENPGKSHTILNDDSKSYLFFGSFKRDINNDLRVLSAHWEADPIEGWHSVRWDRRDELLEETWQDDYRVVLIKK